MSSRKKAAFSQADIDQQLQQIHLLDSSSTSENLEQLAPIIKQIHATRQQDAFLRTLKGLEESKESEIQTICSDNYQDFVSSVSTLLKVRSSTDSLRNRITSLDDSVNQAGKALAEKKKALLRAKTTATNLDEAIETLQACLRLLDLVNRIGELIKQQRYYSALRSLDEIQSLPPTSLSQTPFFNHLLTSLPSLRMQIKDAVTAAKNTWLLELRNVSGQVGLLALEAMDLRTRRWKARKDKDPQLKLSRVGGAVELITNEKVEYNVLDNDKLKVDFKPLYQCILIYTALDSLPELQKSYQADRKTQSTLILSSALALQSLPVLTQEITGFFISETHVLRTSRGFRTESEVEELWEGVVARLNSSVSTALEQEPDPDIFLAVKECLLGFIMTMEGYNYDCHPLHGLILILFEKYAKLLENKYGATFDQIVLDDDNTPIRVDTREQRSAVLDFCWLQQGLYEDICKRTVPTTLPFSLTFSRCCKNIRGFVQKFYQFIEGVSQHHRDIDELLGKSLDLLLTKHISDNIATQLETSSTLSQIAQIVTNLEYFEVACGEVEKSLASMRTAQRGGTIHLTCRGSFMSTTEKALERISNIIASKLQDSFELSEYDWTPSTRMDTPSGFLFEMVFWLTMNVDGLAMMDVYKDKAYDMAIKRVADCLMEPLTGPDVNKINEDALSNLLVDVDFLESEFRKIGHGHLNAAFQELRTMVSIPLNNTVSEFLNPQMRASAYTNVKPRNLHILLEKLARYGSTVRTLAEREKAERRRKEAEAVSKIA